MNGTRTGKLDGPTKNKQANRLLDDFSYVPIYGMTGECVVALMRYYGVTIRFLAASMGVTMKRVREVRNNGITLDRRDSKRTVLIVQDWIQGIETAALKKS
jgi:hypothetical protein